MADPVLLNDCRVWFAGYDLSGSLNSIEIVASKAEQPNSRFGDTAETFFPGIASIRGTVKGFFSSSTLALGEPDPVIMSQMGITVTEVLWPIFFTPPYAPTAAAGAVSNIGYLISGMLYSYKRSAAHGDLLMFEVTTLPVMLYELTRQTIERAKALVSATTTSTGTQHGALSATQELVVSLHVFAITGGSWVLTIESDDNAGFTTPTVRGTFTAVTTAANFEIKKISGAVTDDYWRAVLTKTGGTNITYAVTMGIGTIA